MAQPEFEGTGLIPGRYGTARLPGLSRPDAEAILRSWFAWLRDRSRVYLSPAQSNLEAEFLVRRWKTKPAEVEFRWRNSGATRHSFMEVVSSFKQERRPFTIELTAKTRRPRAIVTATLAEDVLAPSWAMGVAIAAFAAATERLGQEFDLCTQSHVLPIGMNDAPLVPLSRSYRLGRSFGKALGRLTRRT